MREGPCVGGCVHMCLRCACETVCTWKALDRWLLQLSLNVASFFFFFPLRVKPLSYRKCLGQHYDQGRLFQPSWLFAGHLLSVFILPPSFISVWFRRAGGEQSFDCFCSFFLFVSRITKQCIKHHYMCHQISKFSISCRDFVLQKRLSFGRMWFGKGVMLFYCFLYVWCG